MYATASCPIFPQAEQSGSPEARKAIRTVISNFILKGLINDLCSLGIARSRGVASQKIMVLDCDLILLTDLRIALQF
jgi:hypothetical protein